MDNRPFKGSEIFVNFQDNLRLFFEKMLYGVSLDLNLFKKIKRIVYQVFEITSTDFIMVDFVPGSICTDPDPVPINGPTSTVPIPIPDIPINSINTCTDPVPIPDIPINICYVPPVPVPVPVPLISDILYNQALYGNFDCYTLVLLFCSSFLIS